MFNIKKNNNKKHFQLVSFSFMVVHYRGADERAISTKIDATKNLWGFPQ